MTDEGQSRSDADEKVAELLRAAREALGFEVTFLTRFEGPTQHFEVIEATEHLLPEGHQLPRSESICQAIVDGKLPAVIPKVAKFKEAKRLLSGLPQVKSFVSVPVHLSDGSLYGTFCAAGFHVDKGLSQRDESMMQVLADAAAAIVEPSVREHRRHEEIRGRLIPVMSAGGPTVVLQPIVDLPSGARVGAEALSRFPAEWAMAPDVVFAEARSIGAGLELELLAFRSAAMHLSAVPGYVAINFSPATILTSRCQELLADLPLERVLLELSEHDPVEDYDELAAALAPLRARGMRLAIDDVGAGYSSMRHIVLTAPDVLKLDRSIVAGVATHPMLETLVSALSAFAHGSGAKVVAEGIETVEDAIALRELGVDYGQGWLFGRPGPAADLRDTYAVTPELTQPI